MFFLFDADDRLVPLARDVVDEVIAGSAGLPEHAGRRICFVTVVSWLEGDKPVVLADIATDWWTFDGNGRLAEDPAPTDPAAAPELTEDQRKRVLHAVWPKAER
ncbi:MAG: hypothetical protein R3C97_10940 [Geminicoccaceae bacterium]